MGKRKQLVLDYILKNFDNEDFQWNLEVDGNIKFKSYEEFKNFQRSTIEGFNGSSLAAVESLIELIPKIDIMDKEGMRPWRSSGFLYNGDGRIVIFHPR